MRTTAGGMPIPETRYARAGGVSIAYQVWGSGPVKVLFVPGGISAIDLWWEWPTSHHFFERLGSFATIAWFDKRGTGASDRLDGPASVEERSDDIRVMLAELGWERAVLWGNSEGGSMALLYAATHPDHVEALLLQGTFARFTWADDYPMGYTDEAARLLLDLWVDKWGTPETYTLPFFVPSQMGVPGYLEYLNRIERHSSPPSLHRAMMELNYQIDVRHAVPLVQCPSLVLHAPADRVVPVEHGRWLAEHIPDARLLEYEGEHFSCYVGVDEWVEAVENFLTGHASAPVTDRVLATVVFTDIVDSTMRAAELGDQAWRALLDRHDAALGSVLRDHRGHLVKTTGDGVVATFDSPTASVRAARRMVEAAAAIGVPIRAGIHTGEVERRGDDIAGIAVHIAARVGALAGSGEVLVSGSVPPLVVGSGLAFTDRGEHDLKGIPDRWRLHAVN